jgi:hypothetical protein
MLAFSLVRGAGRRLFFLPPVSALAQRAWLRCCACQRSQEAWLRSHDRAVLQPASPSVVQ